MVVRILTAVVGAAIITTGMLLGMHEVTKQFNDKDPVQYFGIADFLPAPEGRRKPTPIPAPEAPPDRPRLQYEGTGEPRLPVEAPELNQDRPVRILPAEPLDDREPGS